MKSVLFATTALVATAGIASADIALSGSAEMGVVGGDVYGDETQFWTDIDVTFSMSGETDNGLSFTATVDLDENGAFAGTTQGGETIAISGGGATLTMGDTDGAFDAALTEVGIGGSIDDAHTAHVGYSGNSGFDGTYDGQVARFTYAFEGFTGHVSAEIDDTGNGDPVWGVGVSYSANLAGLSLGVGLGYQTTDGGTVTLGSSNGGGVPVVTAFDDVYGISLSTTFDNGLQAVVNYSQFSGDNVDDLTHTAIGLGYAMNALTIGFNYGVYEQDGDSVSGYGLAVDYDLGGGAQVQFGYGSSDLDDIGGPDSFDQYSLGISMSF
ncbi:porin [Pseudaestuariivita sp.]|uniref:porin n=1 Tax=Pseudaestuariivita sp. TaxID=2211669 RepID=UPI004057F458